MAEDFGRDGDCNGKARPRRQLMTGAAGALGGLAAGSLLRASPAQATQGSAVIEGQDNTGATARTGVFTTGNHEFGILADPNSSGKGSLGVFGFGANGGVRGESSAGYGVAGKGVTGVIGDGATGVWGSGTDYGVIGYTGSPRGAGVLAQANAAGAVALECLGPAQFDRSGLAIITFPQSSASVPVRGGLSQFSLVLAVMQNAIAGVYVTSAVPDMSTGNVTIHLNKAPGSASRHKTARVAWFVIN